ncbi:MAG: thioredoxin family protein [Alphaproteobacteria bacterium]|nr:thioredoxin family protein [Alphaproteobacteria bacterium]
MAALETPPVKLGWHAPDFRLKGTDGKLYALGDVKGAKGLLVMFICNHCPFVQAVADKLTRDAKELASLGIGSVAIMANDSVEYPEDSFDNMILSKEKHGFPFPYLIDETQEVAKAYGAVCTPDFFGFDADLALQYRGRLDASGMKPVEGGKRELFEAMKQVAETGKAPAEQMPSIGCSIKWRDM